MKFLFVLLTFCASVHAEMPIDTVYSFTPGEGQDYGRGEEVFPANIFGFPSSKASRTVPASAETEVVSLGLGGEIVVGIKDFYIVDGDGNDFTIFENAFYIEAADRIFAEPAIISVSEDGVNFVEFPYDSLTLDGLAGKTPTYAPGDTTPDAGLGGDSYDLADLGLEKISYIKIKDVAHYASLDPTSFYYSPLVMLSGFDLDAVLAHYVRHQTNSINELPDNINLRYYSDYIAIESSLKIEYKLYNLAGETVIEGSNPIIATNSLPAGIYFLQVFTEGKVYAKKLMIR